MDRKEKEPVFPATSTTFGTTHPSGLTKRELFAMGAMQGFLGHDGAVDGPDALADRAVQWADALLRSLAKPVS